MPTGLQLRQVHQALVDALADAAAGRENDRRTAAWCGATPRRRDRRSSTSHSRRARPARRRRCAPHRRIKRVRPHLRAVLVREGVAADLVAGVDDLFQVVLDRSGRSHLRSRGRIEVAGDVVGGASRRGLQRECRRPGSRLCFGKSSKVMLATGAKQACSWHRLHAVGGG